MQIACVRSDVYWRTLVLKSAQTHHWRVSVCVCVCLLAIHVEWVCIRAPSVWLVCNSPAREFIGV